MRLRISGRSSDLSRIQIQQVADAIRAARPGIEITPLFRESLGDRMQHDPLWKMPEKGVFTEDFVDDLKEGRTDVVVHSWKDLPTEPREGTVVAGTLPRADVRDVLLLKKDFLRDARPGTALTVLTSSPRRAHNLRVFLEWALPRRDLRIEFAAVRGNVPTRIRKLIEGEGAALVVAKAALDRLLGSEEAELKATRAEVRSNLDRCHWMILPIRANPTGAAQGALAMEVATNGDDTASGLVEALNDETTFEDAAMERRILRSYGGGCHQKIGVTVLSRPYGRLISLRGLTDEGETLDRFELETVRKSPAAKRGEVWPEDPKGDDWFRRERIESEQPRGDGGYWVARADALPDDWSVERARPVWTAGLRTWRKLAERGIWVNGSAEGLGEREDPLADLVAGRTIEWIKLTHDRSATESGMEKVATYRLVSDQSPPDLSGYTHYFWTSGSRFLEAFEKYPELSERWHACGPGSTFEIVRDVLGGDERLEIWLDHASWLKGVTG